MMDKRIYGVLGVQSKMSNWNADFTGHPKSLTNGEIFGSDKALKYSIREVWKNIGEIVLYTKNYKINDKGQLQPLTLKEKYEKTFDTVLNKDGKEVKTVLTNLFSATDVKNFGATFAEANNNLSITGAVQITQGMNKYEDTEIQEQQILSPFKNSNEEKETAKTTTLGTQVFTDEAHYFYSFSINPQAYRNFTEIEDSAKYTEEDYEKFKYAALRCATAQASNTKVGCDNEFGLFVETEEDTYMPNLAEFIEFEKTNDKNIIRFTDNNLLNYNKIKKIDIYYNPTTTELEGFPEKSELFSIITEKEV